MSLEERARSRLTELEAARERFIADAQRQLAAFDGSIAEIKALLEPPAAQNGTGDEPVPAEAEAATVG